MVFKKGQKAWNKGLKGYTNSGSFKKGQNKGDKNPAKKFENRKKISQGLMGRKCSKETREKISNANKGRTAWNKNIPRSENTKRKIRITKQKRFLKLGISSSIGKNETQILDELEKIYKSKIIRQYPVIGYYLDGYICELNLAIEVDEYLHYNVIGKLREKDIIRQKNIEQELGCNFLRIEDKIK